MGSITRVLTSEAPRPRAIREHPWAPWMAVGVVCFGAFMGQLDASIVTLAFPALQRQFGVSLAGVQWVSLVYLLVLVALLIPIGRWSDRSGRKLLYTYGFVVFSAASIGCGLAPSLDALIGFRVIQAIGAAMLQANSIALVSTSVAPHLRRKALGIQAMAQAAGLALGPTAGGIIVAASSWRWVFLINPPVGVVAIILGIYMLPRTKHRAEGSGADLPGVVLLGTSVAGLLLALSVASGLHLGLAAVIGLVVVAVGAAVGLVWWERRSASPMIDGSLLSAPGVARGLGGALLAYMILFGPLVLYPQVFDALRGGVTASTGFILTALPAGFAVAAVAAERVLPAGWSDYARCWIGGAITILGAGLLAFITPSSGVTAALLAVLGIGLGVYIPANNAQIMGAVPPSSSATMGGMLNMGRGIGTAFGVALVTLSLYLVHSTGSLQDRMISGGRLTMIALGVCAVLATLASAIKSSGGTDSGHPVSESVHRGLNPENL